MYGFRKYKCMDLGHLCMDLGNTCTDLGNSCMDLGNRCMDLGIELDLYYKNCFKIAKF